MFKQILIVILLQQVLPDHVDRTVFRYRNMAGFYNNPAHVDWGSIGMHVEPLYGSVSYVDGIYEINPEPNPRKVTSTLFRGQSGLKSSRFTTMFAYFSQLITREIVDIDEPGCPREIMGVDVSDDEIYTKYIKKEEMLKMPVYRSNYDKNTGVYSGNPRKPINGASSWIDGSFIYGAYDAWTDAMRMFDKGFFNLTSKGLPVTDKFGLPLDNFPPPRTHKFTKPSDFWVVGDRRAHENPVLLSLSILFMRYHNVLALEMSRRDETLTDAILFAKARAKVIGVLQSIVYYEWLPALLGDSYDPNSDVYSFQPSVKPDIDTVFAAVASKWTMTLIPSAIPIKSQYGCNLESTLRLCNSWFDGQHIINSSSRDLVEGIITGAIAQSAEKEDAIIVEDLLDYSYGPIHFSRMDAAAEAILRGRDFGVRVEELVVGNNIVLKSWDDLQSLNINGSVVNKLKDLYGENNFSNIDLFVLYLLQNDAQTSGPGSFVKDVIKNQIKRVRDADYFWFENRHNGLFTDSEIQEIRNTRLSDVMRSVFGSHIANVASFVVEEGACELPSIRSSDLIPCTPLKLFDYFGGNEFAFIISFVWIGLFPFVVIGLAYGCYRLSESKKMKNTKCPTTKLTYQLVNDGLLDSVSSFKGSLIVDEWIGDNVFRTVRVRLDDEKYIVYVMTLEGQPLRSINMSAYEVMTLLVCQSSPFIVLLELPKSYDLVLRFLDVDHLTMFTNKLNQYVYAHSKLLVRQPARWKAITRKAVTKKKRKEKLDAFFRNVFAHAFNKHTIDDAVDMSMSRDFVEFEISKEEFADSLGVNPNSTFVELMFNVADKQKRGFLRFREILELVIIMSQGSPDRKLELLFDMFDFNGDGHIARTEVSQVVRSLVDLAGSYMENESLENIVTEMYSCAGLSDKDELDFNDFKRLLTSRDQDFISKVGVDWKGIKSKRPEKKNRPKFFQPKAETLKPLATLEDDSMNTFIHSQQSIKRRRSSALSTQSTIEDIDTPVSSVSSFSAFDSPLLTPTDNQKLRAPLGSPPGLLRPTSLNLKKSPLQKLDPTTAKFRAGFRYFENRKRELSVLFFFYAVCIGLFLERFLFYVYLNDGNGVRQTLSYGVAFARGAAEVCSFTFSILLVTMCYNMVRLMRETFLNLYIPFDKNIVFHKIVAWTGLAFAAVHTLAYGFNYYFLASGPASHACFFDNLVYPSNGFIRVGPTLYTSLPGLTGVFLILVLMVMYIFASQTARRYMHNTFWMFHKLFIALYVLMLIHGLLWLTQKPNFVYHFLGPCLLFIIDKTMSVTRRKMKLDVLQADMLPSYVTRVLFKRPANFEYKSGMWVRISCDALGSYEYHPFTLTSSPHEDYLSLHIRGVGPWTKNIRNVLQTSLRENKPLPSIYLDGPFGSGQQDWFNFEVSVLVGAGIGVTPYASILKDFVHMMRTKNRFKVKCQKVYFIWSTSNQKSFEWFIDILKQVEEVDINCTVSTNIFITQFFQGFDLRTSMLYVFEEHAKRVGGCSLFTGLKATTNFGRPNFNEIFHKISEEHLKVKNIGVFSCGPPGLTKGVEQACIKSSSETHSQFQHHYENF